MCDSLFDNEFGEVRITFGMIVLNGEPFTLYNLRSIYQWAHQIVVVEGACLAASSVATEDGHSSDGTLDVLRRFKLEEDPENKVNIVTAEDEGHPNGFWPGEKHEMSQAYAKRVTGNFLWQVDVDEFYRTEDMPAIISLLKSGVDAVTFPTYSFWGGLDFLENGEYFIAHRASEFARLFAWGLSYTYSTHRPPTVLDQDNVDTRNKKWIRASQLRKSNIYMYHYSMLLPKQVMEKCSYYSKVNWASFQELEQYAEEVFFALKKPFAVCNSLHCPLSWIESFHGSHPNQIMNMINNVQLGMHAGIELRNTEDISLLLKSPSYIIGKLLRRIWVSVVMVPYIIFNSITRFLKRSSLYPILNIIRQNLRSI